MPRLFLHHYGTNEVDNLSSPGAIAQHVAQRMFDGGKETGANLAVGSQANPRAGAAEGFRNRRDDSDFPGAPSANR